MKARAKSLLNRIGKSQECAIPLTKGNQRDAAILVEHGYAEVIPESRGGGTVALTNEGVMKYMELFNPEDKKPA